MQFAISPPIQDGFRLAVVHVPPPTTTIMDGVPGEMHDPTLVACLNCCNDMAAQIKGMLPAPLRLCNHTGRPVYRHDGQQGGGRSEQTATLYEPTLPAFLDMFRGSLAAMDELGAGQRSMHLVLSAGASVSPPTPAALQAQQFERELAQLELPDTVAITVWLVQQPWGATPSNSPATDAFCRQLQQQVLTHFSWGEIDRTPHKKKTYHGMMDSHKDKQSELYYEGDMLRSLVTADTCPLEVLLLVRHLPSNKIRVRLAPSTAYVGQTLAGLPPHVCSEPTETEIWPEGVDHSGLLQGPSAPLVLSPCSVQLCTAPRQRCCGVMLPQQCYRLTQQPGQAARFGFLVRGDEPVTLRASMTEPPTQVSWEQLDGTPVSKLQQASMGHLHLQDAVLEPVHTFEQVQPVLEHLWTMPTDLPSVSGHHTAQVLQQYVLQMRDRLCQAFSTRVQGTTPLPLPALARQMSCLTPWKI